MMIETLVLVYVYVCTCITWAENIVAVISSARIPTDEKNSSLITAVSDEIDYFLSNIAVESVRLNIVHVCV